MCVRCALRHTLLVEGGMDCARTALRRNNPPFARALALGARSSQSAQKRDDFRLPIAASLFEHGAQMSPHGVL